MSLSLQERESKFLATTAKKVKYIKALAQDPENVKLALKTAGLPMTLADDAECWDETLLIRREIRKALDTVGATAQFVAERLYDLASKNNVRAIELICKLRGYNEPISKSSGDPGRNALTPDERERLRRRRITDLLNLPYYPIPEEAPGASEGDTFTDPRGDHSEARLVGADAAEQSGEDSIIEGEETVDAVGVTQ